MAMPPVITYFELSNGLRCVHCLTGAAVEYCGVSVDAGSRDDFPGMDGLAHFVEHTIFKGTTHRRSWHIINRMESCGGELNAYTTKESTVVYSVFPYGNFARAAELISDLVCNSVFPQKEIDREREVVADEISSYLDMPSEAVFDDFEDLIFAGSPLGHNILGNEESLGKFTPEVCRDYLTAYYNNKRMVMFYAGPMPSEKVRRVAERYFASIPVAGAAMPVSGIDVLERDTPSVRPCFDEIRDLGIHQAHTVMGARIPDMFSPERHAVAMLVNMLGGPGMNSLLNVALREKRGLVYSVDASTSLLTDTGLFTLYFGCDADDVERCRDVVSGILSDLASHPISNVRLDKVKRQYLGQIAVASDNRENAVLSMARSVLYHGAVVSPSERTEIIKSISPDDMLRAASYLAPERLSVLTFR